MAWPKWLNETPERREQARALGLANRTHGKRQTPAWNSWRAMKARCDNPKDTCFRYYGGRGIGYDLRWAKFENFLEDMGERPEGMSLDRIDPDLGYSKENCRWADATTQRANQRRAIVREIAPAQGGQ